MSVYVKEYDWMWDLGLSLAESRVYGYIYGLTNGKDREEKGYKGSARQLGIILRLDESGSTASKVLQKLLKKNLIVLADGRYMSAELNRKSAELNRKSADLNRKSADLNRTPHTPLYNNSLKINNNIQAKPKAMDGDAGLGGTAIDSFSLALFTEYYQLFPYRAKNDRIKQTAQTEFCSLSPEKQQLIIDTLRQQIDNDEKLPDTSPLMYIRHFDKNAPPPEGEPVNYNNGSIPDGKFVQPAKYKGQWGMYCLADIIKYNLEVKQD